LFGYLMLECHTHARTPPIARPIKRPCGGG
jgi:hypothetical protein